MTDQEGVAGLTGEVDQHYWRLFGAVFIGGALKGGMDTLRIAIDPGRRGRASRLRDCHLWQSGDQPRGGTGARYASHHQGPCRPTLPRVADQGTEAPRDVAMTRLPDETASARGAPAVPPESASWLLVAPRAEALRRGPPLPGAREQDDHREHRARVRKMFQTCGFCYPLGAREEGVSELLMLCQMGRPNS